MGVPPPGAIPWPRNEDKGYEKLLRAHEVYYGSVQMANGISLILTGITLHVKCNKRTLLIILISFLVTDERPDC